MNDPHVMQLQHEAERRVQRMAERSRRLVREHPVNIYRATTVTPCAPCEQPKPPELPTEEEPCAVCEPTPCEPLPTPCQPTVDTGEGESILLLLLKRLCTFPTVIFPLLKHLTLLRSVLKLLLPVRLIKTVLLPLLRQ